MNSINFTIIGRPQQRGSKVPVRTKDGRVFIRDANLKSKDWMTSVRQVAGEAWDGKSLITSPVRLSATFYFKRPKSHYRTAKGRTDELKGSAPRLHAQSPDLAKLIRCLEDALTGVIWQDDKLVRLYAVCSREWTTESERAEVAIVW